MLYLSEDIVKQLLNWKSTVQAVKAAMLQQHLGKTMQNQRSITATQNNNLLFTMPGFLQDEQFGALACKLVTSANSNQTLSKPLPNIMANIALFNENTGELKAIIAGTEITTWRTAAASVVATQCLIGENDKKGPLRVAILGAGVQGRIHALAFKEFFNISEITLWNHKKENAIKLKEELNFNIKVKDSVEEAVKDADVIITATSSSQPILFLDWIKNGAHINAVGVQNGDVCELDLDVYLHGDVYVDHRDAINGELKRLKQKGVNFLGEIGGLVAQTLKPKEHPRITVFQSLGMAVEDCAMARLIYDKYDGLEK